MKVAHLILTHKNPQQLEKMINLLEYPGFDFFIHIDKKADAEQFSYLFRRNNIFQVKNRTKIYWAGYGTIQATINGFREIVPLGYDYINVISGQDFPLKTAAEMYRYFELHKGKEFITCESMDGAWNVGPRVRNYHLINWRIPGKFRLEKLLNKVLPKRKFPFNWEIVGRANWFMLSNEASAFILDFIDKHPQLERYFKYCWGADEFMFSSVLYNTPAFRHRIIDNFIYVDWSEGHAHPKILGKEDFEQLKMSDKLFGRKFDMDKDPEIIALLEQWLRERSSTN